MLVLFLLSLDLLSFSLGLDILSLKSLFGDPSTFFMAVGGSNLAVLDDRGAVEKVRFPCIVPCKGTSMCLLIVEWTPLWDIRAQPQCIIQQEGSGWLSLRWTNGCGHGRPIVS
jgi:hypothetical protein